MHMEILVTVLFFAGVLLLGLGLPWLGHKQEQQALLEEELDSSDETTSQ